MPPEQGGSHCFWDLEKLKGVEEVQIEKQCLQRPGGVNRGLGVVCIIRPHRRAPNRVNFCSGAKTNRGAADTLRAPPATSPALTLPPPPPSPKAFSAHQSVA